MRAALLARVSTEVQAQEGMSLGAQLGAMESAAREAFIEKHRLK